MQRSQPTSNDMEYVEGIVKEHAKNNKDGIRLIKLAELSGIDAGRLYYRVTALAVSGRVRIQRPYPGVVLVLPGGQA